MEIQLQPGERLDDLQRNGYKIIQNEKQAKRSYNLHLKPSYPEIFAMLFSARYLR